MPRECAWVNIRKPAGLAQLNPNSAPQTLWRARHRKGKARGQRRGRTQETVLIPLQSNRQKSNTELCLETKHDRSRGETPET